MDLISVTFTEIVSCSVTLFGNASFSATSLSDFEDFSENLLDLFSVSFFGNKSLSITFFDDNSLLVTFFDSLTGLSSSPHKARSRREGDETRLDFENKFPEFSRTFLSRPVDEVDLKNRFRKNQY